MKDEQAEETSKKAIAAAVAAAVQAAGSGQRVAAAEASEAAKAVTEADHGHARGQDFLALFNSLIGLILLACYLLSLIAKG
jgi:hypothetical protein